MKKTTLILSTVVCAGLLLSSAIAEDFAGTARIGYIYVDDEGNRGVHQPTFNLYEGPALSLENFHYTFNSGVRAFGDLRNLTLNNRNLALGLTKPGLFGVTLRHNQYRRVYTFEGDRFTRRYNTNGQVWFQPHQIVKLFGGLGLTEKRGDLLEIFTEPPLGNPLQTMDYTHTFYNVGAIVGNKGRFAQAEYRGSDFNDDAVAGVDRERRSQRLRLSVISPVPNLDNLVVQGGFQRFEYQRQDIADSLTANTLWGGARYFFRPTWSLRYSFIWDRARRTGDLVSTDNITHSVYADKVFRGVGGFTLGYRYHINDDVRDELRGNGYVVSGWLRPFEGVTVRAGHGADLIDVKEGRTLVGDEDRTRFWGSIGYRYDHGSMRVKVEDRSTEFSEIGSEVDFLRASSDLSAVYDRFGELSVSYAYYNGKYDNNEGASRFEEHVVNGDLLSAPYHGIRAGFGGMYMRSRLDADVESFSVRVRGIYAFMPKHQIEVIYSAHNFDNFADPAQVYTEYYTANVVEVNLVHEF